MPDAAQPLSVNVESSPVAEVGSVALRPYTPERQRDWVRTGVTFGLLVAFGGVIFWACKQSTSGASQWAQTKEMLQIILPAITGLLGSVIGFYFGVGSAANNRGDQ